MLEKTEIKKLILKQIKFYSDIAHSKGYNFTVPLIDWNLKGKIAGKANANLLKFNLELAFRNLEKFLTNTVPHEMAHVLQRRQYPKSKPHGKEWVFFCKILTGKILERCHSYDTSHCRKNSPSPLKFACLCKEHTLSPIRAQRIKRGNYQYFCRKCKGTIKEIT